MSSFGRVIKKLWHSGVACLGCWLFLYLVILGTQTLWHCENCFAHTILVHVLARAELAHEVPEITDRPGPVHSERSLTCPQVPTILRILSHLEKYSFGNCLSGLKSIK